MIVDRIGNSYGQATNMSSAMDKAYQVLTEFDKMSPGNPQPSDPRRREARDRLPAESTASSPWPNEARHDVQERRFPGTVWTNDGHNA